MCRMMPRPGAGALFEPQRAVQTVASRIEHAWAAYAPPVPDTAMSKPARAGPVLRATLKTIELRPIALIRWLDGTTSATIAALDGCWKVCTIAMAKAVTYTCHGWIGPVIMSSAMHANIKPSSTCATMTCILRE